MAVIDICTYNGEKDIWDIHYNVLKDYVDEFIVVEFDKTFSGKEKPWLFESIFLSYTGNGPFVRYVKMSESAYEKYRELAESSPNTIGADHWKLEFMQKESIKDALTHLEDDDIVFIGDVDEVWDWTAFAGGKWNPLWKILKLKLKVYTYWLNNRSSEKFAGTLVGNYKDIKGVCLNHLRTHHNPTYFDHGWHFTSMGGEEALRKKLTDSYTQESYATPLVLDGLGDNMANDKDFLGRDFTYHVDESQWPQYIKDNKEKYQHLCK